jgi:hypothetical protein
MTGKDLVYAKYLKKKRGQSRWKASRYDYVVDLVSSKEEELKADGSIQLEAEFGEDVKAVRRAATSRVKRMYEPPEGYKVTSTILGNTIWITLKKKEDA